jgi:GT2 family glycosyltransferase
VNLAAKTDVTSGVQREPQAPRVTALIVSYNSVAALRRCVQSIETAPEIETLVVDLGSQDGSPLIDVDFPHVTVLRLPKHFGATKAMNIATRTAAADYLLYLDPNVTLDKGVVMGLAAILDADATVSAVCPLLKSESGKPVPQVYKLPDSSALAEACESGSLQPYSIDTASAAPVPVEYASRCALMVRKDFVRGMNFFDERYGHAWPDLELAWQIQNAQRRTVVATKLGATWHEPEPQLAGSTTIADRYNGAAGYLGKHNGFASGLAFRISSIFKALFSFRIGLLSALLSGQKIDGTQASL